MYGMSDRMTNAHGHDDAEKERPVPESYTVPSDDDWSVAPSEPLSEIPANEGGEG